MLVLGTGALFFWGALGRSVELPEKSPYLDLGLATLFAIWVVGLIIAQRGPSIPALFWMLTVLILSYGWIAVLNAETTHVWGRGFQPAEYTFGISWLPMSKDQASSQETMIHISALFAGLLVVVDLTRSRRLRRQLLAWLVLCGMAVAMAGIFQKASGTEMMWNYDKPLTSRNFFATFDYHGNAATFLNLCWPVAFLLWLRAITRGSNPFMTAVWAAAAAFTFGAIFANTSKVGHVLGILLALAMLISYRRDIGEAFRDRRVMLSAVVAILLLLGAGAYLFSLSADVSLARWATIDQSATIRMTAYQICWRDIVPNAGLTGFGPGSFPTVFAYFLAAADEGGTSFWYRAHQDYFQSIIEWGIYRNRVVGNAARRRPISKRTE